MYSISRSAIARANKAGPTKKYEDPITGTAPPAKPVNKTRN